MALTMTSWKAYLHRPDVRPTAIVGACFVAALLFTYYDAIGNLIERWFQEEELGHSFFLPLITAWMLWERRDALGQSLGAPVALGLVAASGALVFTFAGAAAHVPMAEQLGLVMLLVVAPLAIGGWSLWRLTVIPLGYLLFMVPPPQMLITMWSQDLQLISSRLGADMIQLMGMPVHVTGNEIQLRSTTLQVVDACSGLRYLFPFLSLSALAAYLYRGPIWQRLALIAAAIPITVLMNSFRVALTAFLEENVGGNHTEGFLHTLEGFMVFVLCMAALFGLIWLFTLMRGEKKLFAFVTFGEVDPVKPSQPFSRDRSLKNGIALTILVLLTGVASHTIGNRPILIPERFTFDTLPFEFPETWKARAAQVNPAVIRELNADDYIITDFRTPDIGNINLYIAYLDARRDGKSWHSPLQCLPGGGWDVTRKERVVSTDYNGEPFAHNQMIIARAGERYLVHYWYEQRGRIITGEFSMRAWVVWDDLKRRRSDGAMVRVMTQIDVNETEADARARLNEARRTMRPHFERYIPS